jgi:hypothetical protein
MRKIPFSSVEDIEKKKGNREIALFGKGVNAEKTMRILPDRGISLIVDNVSNLWGTIQNEVTVKSPDVLKEIGNENIFVVICTTSFSEVHEQLISFGFKADKDFVVSPILNDLRIIAELESIERKLLFTSGSPKQDSDKYGGGIYEMTVKGDTWHYKKVISGNCYGMIKFNDNFISVDTDLGVFEFDVDYNILRNKELPTGTRGHGISYNPERNLFYLAGSNIDGALILNSDFEIIDQINISEKIIYSNAPNHHCNDLIAINNSLYMSMFSFTGNWKLDVFDGGVLEFDLETKKLIGPVISNLWMPHNILFINGSLTVLDSLRGYLRKNNAQVVGEFPAFTRGLAHDGIYFYIGQSRNRNFSKFLGVSNNISIDAGIVIFDENTKVSRTLQLPPKISEIHSIQVVS